MKNKQLIDYLESLNTYEEDAKCTTCRSHARNLRESILRLMNKQDSIKHAAIVNSFLIEFGSYDNGELEGTDFRDAFVSHLNDIENILIEPKLIKTAKKILKKIQY